MTEQATNQAQGQNTDQRQFSIQRIYVKDVSFETPNSPEIFRTDWKPENNLNINTGAKQMGDDLYEVRTYRERFGTAPPSAHPHARLDAELGVTSEDLSTQAAAALAQDMLVQAAGDAAEDWGLDAS